MPDYVIVDFNTYPSLQDLFSDMPVTTHAALQSIRMDDIDLRRRVWPDKADDPFAQLALARSEILCLQAIVEMLTSAHDSLHGLYMAALVEIDARSGNIVPRGTMPA